MKTNDRLEKLGTLPVTRRGFMKGVSAVAAAATFTGCSNSDDDASSSTSGNGKGIFNNPNAPDLREVRKVYSACPVECLHHSYNCQLVGDEVIRVEPTFLPNDPYYTTACARGMSRMKFLTEERVATPMKRIKKGTKYSSLGVQLKDNDVDEWVSITWKQAIEEIGDKILDMIDKGDHKKYATYLMVSSTGNMGPVVSSLLSPFFNVVLPTRISTVGSICCQAASDGMTAVLSERGQDTREISGHAKCIILWGNNPAETSSGYWKFFMDAKANGAKLINIDPRQHVSGDVADQWVSLYPGTDTLFAIGMLRWIFENDSTNGGTYGNLIAEDFLKHRTNAAYLIDISNLKDGDGGTSDSPVDIFNDKYAFHKIQNLKYAKDPIITAGATLIYDKTTGSLKVPEKNLGTKGSTTQEPDLYYVGELSDGTKVATAYQLMRILYAGDLLDPTNPNTPNGNIVASDGLKTKLRTNLYDPYYNYDQIAKVTGTSKQALIDCAKTYATSNGEPDADGNYVRKSIIQQNMGGSGRTENGGHLHGLHCILALITGNIGGLGNGVNDTSGYNSKGGRPSNSPAMVNSSVPTVLPAGTVNSMATTSTLSYNYGAFGYLGRRMAAANEGTPIAPWRPTVNASLNPAQTVDPQVKFIWLGAGNLTVQRPNTNALKEALCSTEMVVVSKPSFSTDAEWCDIYLPATTQLETYDFSPGSRNHYVHLMEGGVKPYGQAKSDPEIGRMLAKYVFVDKGFNPDLYQYFDNTDEDLAKSIMEKANSNWVASGINGYEDLKERKSIRPNYITVPWIPHPTLEFTGNRGIDNRAKIFITEFQSATTYPYPRMSHNPAKVLLRGPFLRYMPALNSHLPHLNDFYIESGYSTNKAFLDFAAVDGFDYPQYRKDYDLCNIQMKTGRTVHSSWTAITWIREAYGPAGIVWIHPEDAAVRGISDGDLVTVRSYIGEVERIAKVTRFIKKGVTGIENGNWDKYGFKSSSTIGAEMPDPMGSGHTHNNTLVTVTKGGLK